MGGKKKNEAKGNMQHNTVIIISCFVPLCAALSIHWANLNYKSNIGYLLYQASGSFHGLITRVSLLKKQLDSHLDTDKSIASHYTKDE